MGCGTKLVFVSKVALWGLIPNSNDSVLCLDTVIWWDFTAGVETSSRGRNTLALKHWSECRI